MVARGKYCTCLPELGPRLAMCWHTLAGLAQIGNCLANISAESGPTIYSAWPGLGRNLSTLVDMFPQLALLLCSANMPRFSQNWPKLCQSSAIACRVGLILTSPGQLWPTRGQGFTKVGQLLATCGQNRSTVGKRSANVGQMSPESGCVVVRHWPPSGQRWTNTGKLGAWWFGPNIVQILANLAYISRALPNFRPVWPDIVELG